MKLTGRTAEIAEEQYQSYKTPAQVLGRSFMTKQEQYDLLATYRKLKVTTFDPVGAAEADPKGNKLTKITWPREARWRYYGKINSAEYRKNNRQYDSRGWEVRFCWSTVRNQAGYFLSWVEKIPPEGSKAKSLEPHRTQWAARKSRKRASALARRRAIAFEARKETT